VSNQIVNWNVVDFKSTISLLLQQKGSKLRHTVMTDSYTGEGGRPVQQIGQVVAQERTNRHADTPLIETPHDARWVEPSDFEIADLVDDQDKLRLIADPTSTYALNMVYAIGRAMDDKIIAAALGTAKTGKQGVDTTIFDTDNTIASSSVGLTVLKLREAKKILMANEVDIDNDQLFVAVTAEQHDDMLSETQSTSLDYNNKATLVDGKITAFMGFNFIHTERLGIDGASARRLPCWAKSGMHLGLWNDITTRISERADKSYATQIYAKGTFGATRLEEGKVVEILCSE